MSRFQLRELRVDNYRCFDELTLPLEEDTTILFAENGGGKTALLTALAMGLAVIQRDAPKTLKLNAGRDSRRGVHNDKGAPEPAGPCEVTWTAAVGETETVTWSTAVQLVSGRTRHRHRHRQIFEAVEQVRVPGVRWPLFAWYGVDRLERLHDRSRKVEFTRDRWEAYASALDPNLDEAPLLQWLQNEFLGDTARRQQKQTGAFFFTRPLWRQQFRRRPAPRTPGTTRWRKTPSCAFEDGHEAPWSELSDGYHVFIALVADIARRAVMLNEFDGADAPARVEGVVLIDELDLHLHPRWQRVALPRLREAFPRLQFIISTHSPQVLSSAENRQIRRLVDRRLQAEHVFVEGRDTNAILREYMHTEDRDGEGTRELKTLHVHIDQGRREEAEELYKKLLARWGDLDPDLIEAKVLLDLEE